jgi:hypothetical protein
VEVLHAALRDKALGVVLNKVAGKPGREFLRMYGRLGRVGLKQQLEIKEKKHSLKQRH